MTNRSVHLTAAVMLIGACLAAGGAAAAEWERFPGVPYVTTDGTAEAEKVPDRAHLRFETRARAPDARAAYGLLSSKADKLIAALRGTGNPDARLTTDGPTAIDVYDITRDSIGREIVEKRVKLGVDATYRVSVRIDGVDRPDGRERLERTIAAAAATDTSLIGTQFTVSDEAEVIARLDREATTAAVGKAKALIEAAGGRPGRVLAVYDSSNGRDGAADLAKPTQMRFVILPGTQRLFGRATVVVEILP